MPSQQKAPLAQGSSPFAPTAAKAPGDAKVPGQTTTPSETQKQQKNLEKDITNSKTESETKDTKPTPKKGIQEPTPTITKDEKRESQKSRYYEVRRFDYTSILRETKTDRKYTAEGLHMS